MRALLLLVLLAACAGEPAGSDDLDGYWVWKQIVEDDRITLEISDADMVWMFGPGGWPGCPTGVICTRHGIEVLYVGGDRLHLMHRVITGSDFQLYGAISVDDGLVTLAQEQQFSCAHPRDPGTYPAPATRFARARRAGDELWMTPLADADPGAGAATWTVYRRIGQADAHGRYDHPFCGEAREGGTCHCLCPSQDVLGDYACAR